MLEIKHIRRGSVTSTLDEAERLLDENSARHGTLITATGQTQGRGRHGRTWVSAPGNLYASLIMQPECAAPTWPQLSFVMALALAQSIGRLLPHRSVALKWPNDVLVDEKKISGLLLEQKNGFLVIGFGVNCQHHPDDAAYATTDLKAEGASETAPDLVVARIMAAFVAYYDMWLAQGFAPIRTAWLSHAMGIGRPIVVKRQTEPLEGVFSDIAPEDGSLILKTAGGVVRITAGDVYF